MNSVKVLDCTLRDGGYCNSWKFGYENIKKIIKGLCESGINIIECGFLTNKIKYDPDISKFNNISQAEKIIPENINRKNFVLMLNYGEYNPEDLPEYNNLSPLDGLRLAFHKKDMAEALKLCRKIQDKGYKLYIQAMVSLNYSDSEFLNLIDQVNLIQPHAFYIVDSFGAMKGRELTRLFYMTENNLNKNIYIGFHSHNNLQLAYSNAQKILSESTRNNLILDTAVYGMGRGAGNLNTELFVEYLNENILIDDDAKHYKINPLLNIIDEVLNDFYQRNYWGYSLPNYISAVHNAHPNYAGWLAEKNTLTVENMNEIFDMMDEDKKNSFDKNYISELYKRYMSAGSIHEEHTADLIKNISGKKILLIAPGKSSLTERDRVIEFAKRDDVINISVNFEYKYIETDYIFISNLRRYRELDPAKKFKCIVTSNIVDDGIYLRVKYSSLSNSEGFVSDNAGLMAIKFFMNYEIDGIYLAGFDGYSHDTFENYADDKMTVITKNAIFDTMNEGMQKILNEYSSEISIKYLTEPMHVKI